MHPCSVRVLPRPFPALPACAQQLRCSPAAVLCPPRCPASWWRAAAWCVRWGCWRRCWRPWLAQRPSWGPPSGRRSRRCSAPQARCGGSTARQRWLVAGRPVMRVHRLPTRGWEGHACFYSQTLPSRVMRGSQQAVCSQCACCLLEHVPQCTDHEARHTAALSTRCPHPPPPRRPSASRCAATWRRPPPRQRPGWPRCCLA